MRRPAAAIAATGIALVVAAAAGPSAYGQDPGTEVGGTVPSTLELSIDSVGSFAPFAAGPTSRQLVVRARVTSTDKAATLSIADGDVASGPRLGRLSASLSAPLEVRVGASGPFTPLNTAPDLDLLAFNEPVANAAATLRVRQRVLAGERPKPTYPKTLLITLSSDAP
jgi:hypothetical protein